MYDCGVLHSFTEFYDPLQGVYKLASFVFFSFSAGFGVIPVVHEFSMGGAAGLSVSLESNGEYAIKIPATNWRFAGTVGAAAVNVQTKSGADTIGTYTEIAFDFQ